ncbi:MAG: universal stress protein [Thermodesulfobacteriota bacterium]
MIKKIVCASFGTENSEDIINYIISAGKKFNSEIILLYVKPKPYFEGLENIPGDSGRLYTDWIGETTEKEIKRLKKIVCNVADNDLKCRIEVRQGVLHEEILDFSSEENADLISFSKEKTIGHYSPLPRTVLKLIRQSHIPVITVNGSKKFDVKNIVVPTSLYDLNSDDLKYALEISEYLKSKIYHLNVLENPEYNMPVELVSRYRGDAYSKIAQMNLDRKNVEPCVIESQSVYSGISEFVENKKIDLIIMNTYRGEKGRKKEFIGSIAESVIQTAKCPVITIRPL